MKGLNGLIATLILSMWTTMDVLAQCAMCRGTVESAMSNGRNQVATGLNTGILYLLATPYLLVAIVAYLWYQTSKKEHGRRIEISGRVRRALSRL